MFSIFMKEKIVTIGMLICFFVSILLRVFLAALYLKMIHETDNMATTNNKLLKQCKLKFSNCYQLNNGVSNIPVFVEKFMNRLAFGPFSFRMLYHLSGQLMLLSVIISGVGVCRSIIAGCMFGEILPFYLCSMLELYLYFAVTTILDIKGKRKFLKVNLIDYLENHLSNRMQVTRDDIQMLYGKEVPLSKGVDILPIAGWIANRADRQLPLTEETNTMENLSDSECVQDGTKVTEISENCENISKTYTFPALDPEESAELELLLKEILTLS